MVDDQVVRTARAAAERLATDLGRPGLVDDVEAELHARKRGSRPDVYLDPIALGSMIVGVANLAWIMYSDWQKAKKETAPKDLAEAIKAELPDAEGAGAAKRDRIITIVVDETIRIEVTQKPD